jgi:HopA1 effector protein family
MSAVPAELRAFVAALRLEEGGGITLAGRAAGRAWSGEPAQMEQALTLVVYEHAYTRPFPPPADEEDLADEDLTAIIAQANATRPRTETGWTLFESTADGSVVASRSGRTRRFAPGQFMAIDGVLPARAGTPLAVQLPAGSATRQPGFYHLFSEGFRDVNDLSPTVRLYWNVAAAGTGPFVAALTGALNRYEIPFEFKVTARAAQFVRRDNAVLYLSKDSFRAAGLAIQAAMPALAPTLRPGVPLFAKQLAEGVGFAEDPGDGESFGSSRSKLVARALLAARHEHGFPWDAFARHFAETVRAAQLDPQALWLNSGSKDCYLLPQLSPQTEAA